MSVLWTTIFKPANALGQIKNTDHLREGLPAFQQSEIVSVIQDSLTLKQCIKINLEECLHKAYLNRADYRATQKEVEAQAKRVILAHAANWPSLTLYGSYNREKGGRFFSQTAWYK